MRRLATPRWLLAHAAALVAVVSFLLLGWWQFGRAADGNLLSYGYAIQWPAFAAFVVFVWLKEVRRVTAAAEAADGGTAAEAADGGTAAGEAADGGTAAEGAAAAAETGERPARVTGVTRAGRRRPARAGPAYDDSDDESLAAYNRYLAWLNANPDAPPRDYPG